MMGTHSVFSIGLEGSGGRCRGASACSRLLLFVNSGYSSFSNLESSRRLSWWPVVIAKIVFTALFSEVLTPELRVSLWWEGSNGIGGRFRIRSLHVE